MPFALPEFISKLPVFDLLLLTFAVPAFLWGLLRGLNKSLVRLVFTVAVLIITIMFIGTIFNWILDYDYSKTLQRFSIDTEYTSIGAYINSIAATEFLEGVTVEAAAPTVYPAVLGLVMSVVKLVLFILVFFILYYATMPFYLIAGWYFKEENRQVRKVKQDARGKEKAVIKTKKPAKHRLMGGLVSAVGSVVMLSALCLPVVAAMDSVRTIDKKVSLNELVSESDIDLADILKQYDKSVFRVVVGNFDGIIIDGLTTVSVGEGENKINVKLQDVVNLAADVMEYFNILTDVKAEFLTQAELNNILAATRGMITYLFETNNFSKIVLTDLLNYFANNDLSVLLPVSYIETADDGEDAASISGDIIIDALDKVLQVFKESPNIVTAVKAELLKFVDLLDLMNDYGMLLPLAKGEVQADSFFDLFKDEEQNKLDGFIEGLSDIISDSIIISETLKAVIIMTVDGIFPGDDANAYLMAEYTGYLASLNAGSAGLAKEIKGMLNIIKAAVPSGLFDMLGENSTELKDMLGLFEDIAVSLEQSAIDNCKTAQYFLLLSANIFTSVLDDAMEDSIAYYTTLPAGINWSKTNVAIIISGVGECLWLLEDGFDFAAADEAALKTAGTVLDALKASSVFSGVYDALTDYILSTVDLEELLGVSEINIDNVVWADFLPLIKQAYDVISKLGEDGFDFGETDKADLEEIGQIIDKLLDSGIGEEIIEKLIDMIIEGMEIPENIVDALKDAIGDIEWKEFLPAVLEYYKLLAGSMDLSEISEDDLETIGGILNGIMQDDRVNVIYDALKDEILSESGITEEDIEEYFGSNDPDWSNVDWVDFLKKVI